jgi:threonine/homoserine/homoserine lactone efflux protein
MPWPVDPERYVAFLTVLVAMAMMPGPAILFAVAAGMTRGRRGVLLATLGMNLAALMWFVGSALGLLIIAATFPWIFTWVGWLGVAYIGWLGGDALKGAFASQAPAPRAMKAPGLSVFRDGFLVQATNPKLMLFFTAILPPFVDLGRPLWAQMGVFALALLLFDSLFMIFYGLLGAAFAHRFEEARFRRGFSLFVGLVLLLVAALMAKRLLA